VSYVEDLSCFASGLSEEDVISSSPISVCWDIVAAGKGVFATTEAVEFPVSSIPSAAFVKLATSGFDW
jgi:hypothetical protein